MVTKSAFFSLFLLIASVTVLLKAEAALGQALCNVVKCQWPPSSTDACQQAACGICYYRETKQVGSCVRGSSG